MKLDDSLTIPSSCANRAGSNIRMRFSLSYEINEDIAGRLCRSTPLHVHYRNQTRPRRTDLLLLRAAHHMYTLWLTASNATMTP